MNTFKKTLSAAALVVALSAAFSSTASAQWFGGYAGGGHCGTSFGWGYSSGGYCAPAYPSYPVYSHCAPVYTPCYPVYRPVYPRHHRRGW